MIINVDVDKLNSLGLTPNQFILSYLIHMDNKEELIKLRKLYNYPIAQDIKILIGKGYLVDEGKEDNYELSKLSATEDFNSIIYIDSNNAWDEFREEYPKKDDGRPLQGDLVKCKAKYLSIIHKDKLLHNLVMDCIKKEKQARQRAKIMNKFMPGWKMLSTYINQESWKLYEEDVIKDKQFKIISNRSSNNTTNGSFIFGGEIK